MVGDGGTPFATVIKMSGTLGMSFGRCSLLATLLCAGCFVPSSRAQQVGPAVLRTDDGRYELRNAALSFSWSVGARRVGGVEMRDGLGGRTLVLADPFSVLMKNGAVYGIHDLHLDGPVAEQTLAPITAASRYAEHLAGKEVDVPMVSDDGLLHLVWKVVLRDDSAYVRQVLTLNAGAKDLEIRRVEMLDLVVPKAQVVGSVKGSPIVAEDVFFGLEDPLSESNVLGDHATAWVDRELPLKATQSFSYSSVIGVTHKGQMRREFLAYVERERAHPYRTFLHYNSWYDLGLFNSYDEAGALDRVNAFGRELHEKRGVTLDSYLFDDGWDDHASLWRFHQGFPNGFSAVRKAAESYGADPGVWLSPWGGYSYPKQQRVTAGKAQGFEVVDGGFALSGPQYYGRFEEVCLEMMRKYGINQFKFDGTGNASSVFKGSAFDSDFAAAIHLIGVLRKERPDVYINLTTGTYPSPFWLRYADSIWRGGEDDDFAGVGSYRERWITYRDADTYENVVKAGPLFPLNSLMLHGIIYAERHKQLRVDPGNDFRNEVRSYFGTGTQLQEMYITPSLLSKQNWDDLAEAAKWSRSNAEVLKDTHWVGGDPAWQQVYGWASWTPKKAILVLRNPSDKAQAIEVDPQVLFELPEDAAQTFSGHSPWKDDAGKAAVSLKAGTAHRFELAPFEVLTLDLVAE
jgi:hypothetical protein